MQLAPHAVERVRHAADLHDIGKVAIPDAIVNKPGSLDAQEWEFMRRHTLIGERIVRADPALAPLASVVRSTHEHYDGAGYPDALAGDEIPIGARIISACDAFNAMTSDRPYRLARSPQDALAELQRCSGTQFDPDVVAALTALLDRSPVTGDHRPASTKPPVPADRSEGPLTA